MLCYLKTDMLQQGHTIRNLEIQNGILRIPLGLFKHPRGLLLHKPGRIVGPVVPYERGSVIKDAYDPRMFIRSAVPSHPTYYYRQSCGQNQERSATGAEQDSSLQCKQAPQCGMAANLAADTAAPGVVSNPFFMTRVGVPKVGRNDSTLDENFLQVNARYGAGAITSATATTHRNVGAVEYGMTRMY